MSVCCVMFCSFCTVCYQAGPLTLDPCPIWVCPDLHSQSFKFSKGQSIYKTSVQLCPALSICLSIQSCKHNISGMSWGKFSKFDTNTKTERWSNSIWVFKGQRSRSQWPHYHLNFVNATSQEGISLHVAQTSTWIQELTGYILVSKVKVSVT